MRIVKQLLIDNYDLKNLGFDFMGYEFKRMNQLDFHHMLIPQSEAKEFESQLLLDKRGFYYWNGVILMRDVSHPYLHIVQRLDEDMFFAITSELLDQRIKGYIDMENIIAIDDMLTCFEREHCSSYVKGKPVIKEKYLKRALKKKNI